MQPFEFATADQVKAAALLVQETQHAEIGARLDRVADPVRMLAEGVIEGVITRRVKGGLKVDIGIDAFMPASQLTFRPTGDLERYIGQKLELKIIKLTKRRRNVVVSDGVLDSEASWAMETAGLRMWTAMALLEQMLDR